MNAYTPFAAFFDVNMTSKGQVLIPKALRDQIGLRPGKPVAVGLNELGQIVVVTPEEARRRSETADERRLRIRAAVASVADKYDFGGGSTDEIMADLRGDRRP
jgi:AbrB family looped-hinge helix DNA binding protein